jgi:hypothetical protein
MWDRNNAYSYADPSGFTPQRVADCECAGSQAYESIDAASSRESYAVAQAELSPEQVAARYQYLIQFLLKVQQEHGQDMNDRAAVMTNLQMNLRAWQVYAQSSNGNLIIQNRGLNVQIYGSDKYGGNIQVRITGPGIDANKFSNRYGVTRDGRMWQAGRAERGPASAQTIMPSARTLMLQRLMQVLRKAGSVED